MVIARIQGGLGNQLFIYATARRLSLANKMPLKLDVMSGFFGDYYRRKFSLMNFNVKFEKANEVESYVDMSGPIRRIFDKNINATLPYSKRSYILSEGRGDFDGRLLEKRLSGKVYIDGMFQSEGYFHDAQDIIRDDLKIIAPHRTENIELSKSIEKENSVSIHFRLLHGVPASKGADPRLSPVASMGLDYYLKAIDLITSKVADPHFYCFADHPESAKKKLNIKHPVTFVSNNVGDDVSHEDLWLMSQCKHHIIANSTFSWWGAWLSGSHDKMIVAPAPMHNWGHKGLIPDDWVTI
jgi:hypothetical protein